MDRIPHPHSDPSGNPGTPRSDDTADEHVYPRRHPHEAPALPVRDAHSHEASGPGGYAHPHPVGSERARSDDHDHDNDLGSTHGHDHEGGGIWGRVVGFFSPHSHDASDSIDDALEGSREGIRAVKISLLGLGMTALFQLVVVGISGSVALLADTVHNFSDATTAIPLWLAFSMSSRAASRRYTYGYGRAEDLAGVFIVGMIALSAAVAGFESIRRLIDPQPLDHLGWVAIAGLVGFVGNEWVAQYRIRSGQRIGSAALVADGYHARTDGFTSLAVLLGAAGVRAGFPQADPLVGLAITVMILFVLKGAAVTMWHRLMDAIDPDILDRAEAAARSVLGVEGASAERARWIGHSMHAEMHITASHDLSLLQAHHLAEEVRHAILHAVPKLPSVIVHVDPTGHDGPDPHEHLAHHKPNFRAR